MPSPSPKPSKGAPTFAEEDAPSPRGRAKNEPSRPLRARGGPLDELWMEAEASRREWEAAQWDEPLADPQASLLSEALAEFCAQGDLAGARSLLDANGSMDLDAHGPRLEIPLHEALLHGRFDCAELLLARGARPLGRNEAGRSPMDCLAASCRRDPEASSMARLLARHGAAVDEPEPSFGLTPFLRACAAVNLPAAQALAELGADVERLDHQGLDAWDFVLDAKASGGRHHLTQSSADEADERADAMLGWLDALAERRSLGAILPQDARAARSKPRAL